MEIEWILPAAHSKAAVEALLDTYQLDLFVGSVHHVHGIPIDYDRATYQQALEAATQAQGRDASGIAGSGREELLFADYFDAQFEMFQALKPPVIGHFDLIRLLSSVPDPVWKQSPMIWKRIERNLRYVADYGGCLEINSSAMRKGLQEPYPNKEITMVLYAFSC